MKATALSLVVAASLAAPAALADCEMPTLVGAIPDGATATEQELLAVQNRVRAYITAMDEYIACENEEMRAGGDEPTSEYLFLMSSRIDAARSEADAVAKQFNDEVEAFRAAQPPATLPPRSPIVPPAPGSVTQQ